MSVEGSVSERTESAALEELRIQPQGFLIELSLDWIVLRASENVHRFLGESHVTMIDEPLGRFVQAQPLHDLRNLFSRLSGTTGVARAYQVRLSEESRRFDIAFQISDGRVLLEATSSPSAGMGEAIGSVVGLIDGLAGLSGASLRDSAARRMRALTGFDSVNYVDTQGTLQAESRRPGVAAIRERAAAMRAGRHARMIADINADPVPLFPRATRDRAAGAALLRSPREAERNQLIADGIASTMRVPVRLDGEVLGCFECDHCSPRKANLELQAAAELFARMFAMRLEIDGMKTR
jgi:light-regulated signal transduction histidine kinase (bacteriophytochrome)